MDSTGPSVSAILMGVGPSEHRWGGVFSCLVHSSAWVCTGIRDKDVLGKSLTALRFVRFGVDVTPRHQDHMSQSKQAHTSGSVVSTYLKSQHLEDRGRSETQGHPWFMASLTLAWDT